MLFQRIEECCRACKERFEDYTFTHQERGADLGDGQDEGTVPGANGGDYADWTIALSKAERLRHLAGLLRRRMMNFLLEFMS